MNRRGDIRPQLSCSTVTVRQTRWFRFVLAAAFAVMGIWALVKADYGLGAIFIVFAAAWLLLAIFSDYIATLRR